MESQSLVLAGANSQLIAQKEIPYSFTIQANALNTHMNPNMKMELASIECLISIQAIQLR